MSYLPRIVDAELDALMPALPAVALDGPKGVGKTATARQRCPTSYDLDNPDVREVVRADPWGILGAPPPILIDEWQHVPALWDGVRRAVDDGAAPGSFLLAGSACPLKNRPAHSGAGRIVSLRMRPMALCERGVHEATVSLADLLDSPRTEVGGHSTLTLPDYAREIEVSGFPGIRQLGAGRSQRAQLDGYITRVFERDLPAGGVSLRRPATLRAWLAAYADAESTTASWESIRARATPGDADPPTKVTTIQYRDWLTALWLLDPVEAWPAFGRSIGPLETRPTHHLADPALTARLRGLDAADLLAGRGRAMGATGAAFGALFESLATLTVRVLAQAAEARTSHLRTRGGRHEVDLIVEGHDGRLLAIEVKLGGAITDKDVTHLMWLRRTLGEDISLAVVHTGPTAYRRRDGIAVVPLGLLGP